MEFLYINRTTGNVECHPDAMTLGQVQKVYQADKSKSKEHFRAVCTAIYFIFRPRGLYSNKSLAERIKIVNDIRLNEFSTTWEQLIKSPGVKAFMECFIDLTTTINDRAVDSLTNDFNELMQALNEVPTKTEIEVTGGTEALCEDGQVRKIKQSAKIVIPNFDAKQKLWTSFQSYSKSLKEIQAALKIEADEAVKGVSNIVYLYDDPKSNSQ